MVLPAADDGEPLPADVLPAPEPLARAGLDAFPAKRTPPAPDAALGHRAVDLARAQLGKPYQWGAAGPDRFDCSGLVQYVYANLGVSLPRVSSQQAGEGVHVDRKDLAPGDLVFFRLTGNRIDHVGIYVGKGKFIHAPNKRRPVQMDSLNDSWWRRKFKGGRRVG
ncbi:C40 family peptidase [bacterium]|nr:C40 family peptidase [bacterium]